MRAAQPARGYRRGRCSRSPSTTAPTRTWTPAVLDALAARGRARHVLRARRAGARASRSCSRGRSPRATRCEVHGDGHLRHPAAGERRCGPTSTRRSRRSPGSASRRAGGACPWGRARAVHAGARRGGAGCALTGWTLDTHDWRGDGAAAMLAAVAPALARRRGRARPRRRRRRARCAAELRARPRALIAPLVGGAARAAGLEPRARSTARRASRCPAWATPELDAPREAALRDRSAVAAPRRFARSPPRRRERDAEPALPRAPPSRSWPPSGALALTAGGIRARRVGGGAGRRRARTAPSGGSTRAISTPSSASRCSRRSRCAPTSSPPSARAGCARRVGRRPAAERGRARLARARRRRLGAARREGVLLRRRRARPRARARAATARRSAAARLRRRSTDASRSTATWFRAGGMRASESHRVRFHGARCSRCSASRASWAASRGSRATRSAPPPPGRGSPTAPPTTRWRELAAAARARRPAGARAPARIVAARATIDRWLEHGAARADAEPERRRCVELVGAAARGDRRRRAHDARRGRAGVRVAPVRHRLARWTARGATSSCSCSSTGSSRCSCAPAARCWEALR